MALLDQIRRKDKDRIMEILKAKETDIDDIERMYEHIHDEEENGRAVIG